MPFGSWKKGTKKSLSEVALVKVKSSRKVLGKVVFKKIEFLRCLEANVESFLKCPYKVKVKEKKQKKRVLPREV